MCRSTFGGRRACYHLAPSEVSERLTFSFGERDTHSEAMHVVVICVTIVNEGCMATSKHRRAMQVRTQSVECRQCKIRLEAALAMLIDHVLKLYYLLLCFSAWSAHDRIFLW